MRVAKYLSVCLLSLSLLVAAAFVNPDTSAPPVEAAVPTSTIAIDPTIPPVVDAKTTTLSRQTPATRTNPEIARFFRTAEFAGKSYSWDERSKKVRTLQRLIRADRTRIYDFQTYTAHKAWLEFFGWSTDHLPEPPLPPVGEQPGAGQRCPQYEPIALSVGWPASEIPKLSYVMWRESRCFPTAHNPRYPDDSYGLVQLNMRAHKNWVGPIVGWDFNRLFDPRVNLSVGLRLWHMAGGWGPWAV